MEPGCRIARVRRLISCVERADSILVAEQLRFAMWDMCIKPRKVVCLGLGSPASSRDARAQLALLGRLCSFADIVRWQSVPDSAHVNAAARTPQMFHCTILSLLAQTRSFSVSLECNALTIKRHISLAAVQTDLRLTSAQDVQHSPPYPTLFFMPHCDLKLYEIVLRANWSRQRLCSIVFVANLFGDYFDQCAIFSPSHHLTECYYVQQSRVQTQTRSSVLDADRCI